MNKQMLSLVLLVAGVGLLIWGYNISQSVSGQVAQAFSGSPGNKAMTLYIVGAVCTALGILGLVKK